MNILFKQRSMQMVVTGSFEGFRHTAAAAAELLTSLASIEPDVMPTAFQEIGFRGVAPVPVARLGFLSQSRGWQLNIASNQLHLQYSPVGDKFDDDVTPHLVKILERVLKYIGSKAARLALTRRYVMMPHEEAIANQAFTKLVRPPRLFAEPTPVEWTVQLISRPLDFVDGIADEVVNVIANVIKSYSAVSTGTGSLTILTLDVDINTVPENADPRFAAEDLRTFFTAFDRAARRVTVEVEGYIHE